MKRHFVAAWVAFCTALAFSSTPSPEAAQLEPLFIGRPAPLQTVSFIVHVPLRNVQELDQLIANQSTRSSPLYRHFLTPGQFRAAFGPSDVDIARVVGVLRASGIDVTAASTQNLTVRSTVSNLERKFGARFAIVQLNGRTEVRSLTPLHPPAALSQLAVAIDLSPRLRFHTHSMRITSESGGPQNRNSPVGRYWFTDLKQAYQWPSYRTVTGVGRTIGILIDGDFQSSDLDAYFAHEALPTPTVLRRPVLGGAPYDPNHDSFETTLDIEQAGGMAPGATIVHYNIPNLHDDSVLAGYIAIVEDNRVDIVNSSFGGFEAQYTPPYSGGVDQTGILEVYDDLFRQGNAQGITFVASSGDNGGLEAITPEYFLTKPTNPPSVVARFIPGIENPAASPHVTAVGGTNLVTSYNPPSLASTYVRENAYGDPLRPNDPYGTGNLASGGFWASGGGESLYFSKPRYQQFANTGTRHRAVPDLSLHMGGCVNFALPPCGVTPRAQLERSSDFEVLDGNIIGVVGTSAAAPDFAGLLALFGQSQGGVRLGNINYLIYTLAAANGNGAFFRQNIPGNNGLFATHPGFNEVLGNGTLIAHNFALLPFSPVAGDPQTPSNP